jgi:hypothetical protein
MKKRIVRSLVRAVAQSSALFVLLFSANLILGESLEKKPQHSVKDLKLKISMNGRY